MGGTLILKFCIGDWQTQVDADQADVGDEGDVDYKENAKFGTHMKEKGEAASDFSKSKTLAEQRQYLPIYSVRDELLQVTPSYYSLLFQFCQRVPLIAPLSLGFEQASIIAFAFQEGMVIESGHVASSFMSHATILVILGGCFKKAHSGFKRLYGTQVIRENQVVVVVGETGSGKTTQMTQVQFRSTLSDHDF